MKKLLAVLLIGICLNSFSQGSLLKYGQAVITSGDFTPGNWSFMVYDIRDDGTAVGGTNWPVTLCYPPTAAAPDWKFSRTGPLFGVTIDNMGNIYLGSSFVVGAPYPAGTAGGGGIYKVDANTWAVSDFITSHPVFTYNPSVNKLPNKSDGLGDVFYDKYHGVLFASNFEDGNIYRISPGGIILTHHDPFLTDPGIDAPADFGERIWALAVYQDTLENARLYFSRVGVDQCYPSTSLNEIWSIELDPATGNFTGTEQLEFQLDASFSNHKSPISDICFDLDGNMYLAQRSSCGMYTSAHKANVFRFKKDLAGGFSFDREYYLGEYSGRDGAGGIDIGAKYITPGYQVDVCENTLWSTADAVLFNTQKVYGATGMLLTGNDTLVASPNHYISTNLVVDHNQIIYDTPKGKMGDLEIFKDPCLDNINEPVDVPPNISSLGGYATTFNPGKPSFSKPPTNGTLMHGDLLKPGPACTTFFGLVFHNIITSNGDGVNEEIQLTNLCTSGQLVVYNSVGTCVFKTEGTDLRWNANDLEGNLVDAGVYYCVFTFEGHMKNWAVFVTR
ncbi:MAG TPA: gliding motility-associated C-terminal domain-containing protein [Flavobacteriales bacterium]|nr:gliding motility-associated C-terminal domain-containing protein [Flavobacteriales bacterium]